MGQNLILNMNDKGFTVAAYNRTTSKVDDFLANGDASLGLNDIVQQAKATTVGIGIVVEKSFQDGRQRLENEGLNVTSLCKVASLKGNKVTLLGEQ